MENETYAQAIERFTGVGRIVEVNMQNTGELVQLVGRLAAMVEQQREALAHAIGFSYAHSSIIPVLNKALTDCDLNKPMER
jgi:hypothetical protein